MSDTEIPWSADARLTKSDLKHLADLFYEGHIAGDLQPFYRALAEARTAGDERRRRTLA